MGRIERIRQALATGESAEKLGGHYCQSGMPGRRWTVWGRAVGAFEYGAVNWHSAIVAERTYSTREVETMLRETGLLV